MLALFLVLLVFSLRLLSDLDVVVLEVPLFERGGINAHDAVLHQSLGSDQLVIGSVVNHIDNFGLSGNSFGSPVEVTLVQSQSTVFHISSSDSQRTNSLLSQLSVGRDSTQLELALLLVHWHATTGSSSFMA